MLTDDFRLPYPKIRRVSFLLLVLFVTGCDSNEPQEAIIVGGSMAPMYLGEHYRLTCDDCGFGFSVDTDIPKQRAFACPNCAFAKIGLPPSISPADHVFVAPASELARWDVVALQKDADEYATVKRIIGLPGESVQIKEGDIFIDSKRVSKNFAIQKEIRIPVFDSHYRPKSELPNRWRGDSGNSGWSQVASGYRFDPVNPTDNDFDWMTYHHWRGFHHGAERTQDWAVKDSYAFNQAINRTLASVQDLFLLIELDEPAGDFAIRWNHPIHRTEFHFHTDLEQMVVVSKTGKQKIELSFQLHPGTKIELTTFDRVIQVAIDGNLIFSQAQSSGEPLNEEMVYPFSIGAKEQTINIRRIRIFRDVYYRALINTPPEGYSLAENEYYLLGDNVAISIDSRHWKKGASGEEIFGKLSTSSSNVVVD